MSDFLLLTMLGMLSVMDARKKQVPLWGLFALAATALPSFVLHASKRVPGLLFALAGLLLYLLIRRLREAVGVADAAALAACGLGLPFKCFAAGLFAAALLTGLGGLIIWCRNRAREEKIPFLPFLFIGMLAGKIGVICLNT